MSVAPNIGSKIFLIAALSFFPAVDAVAQTIDLRINGLEVGSEYGTVIRKLGKPLSDTRRGTIPCGGQMRTLRYNGLVLSLETGDDRPLGIYQVQITSSRWSVSGNRVVARKARNVAGIRIGAPKARIISKLGIPDAGRDGSGPFLLYAMQEGWSKFYLSRNGNVKMIEWEFNPC